MFFANPLVDFKRRSGLTWAELVNRSEVHLSSLQRVMNAKRPEDLDQVRLITLRRIHRNLGVDFFQYITKE